MSRLPVPNFESDTGQWELLIMCIPDNPTWRANIVGLLGAISYGRAYDESTGYIKPQLEIGEEILGNMTFCKLDDVVYQLALLRAAITGETVDISDPDTIAPPIGDFTSSGVSPTLTSLLQTDNLIYPNENVADVLVNGLIARSADVSLPGEGVGLADLLDQEVTILSDRFRMTDSSIFNPLAGEKNITEALETLLRQDKITDLEFLTPNIVTLLAEVLKVESTSPLAPYVQALITAATGIEFEPPPEYNTVAELLSLIADASGGTPPRVTVNNTVSCGSGCGCGGGGTEPPIETPPTNTDPPPPGYSEPTDTYGEPTSPGETAYVSRQCAIANIIHAEILGLVKGVHNSSILNGVFEWADATVRNLLEALIGYVIGELASPIPLIDGFVGASLGWASNIAAYLMNGTANTAQLILDLQDHEEELVCALASASGVEQAIQNYDQVLTDNGVSVANRGLVATILTTELAVALFFNKQGFETQVENALHGYTPTIPCCSCDEYVMANGVDLGGGVFQSTPTTSPSDPDHYVQLFFHTNNLDPNGFVPSSCGPQVRLLSITPDSAFTPAGWGAYRISSTTNVGSGCVGRDLWCDETPPSLPMDGVKVVMVKSHTPFTVSITWENL